MKQALRAEDDQSEFGVVRARAVVDVERAEVDGLAVDDHGLGMQPADGVAQARRARAARHPQRLRFVEFDTGTQQALVATLVNAEAAACWAVIHCTDSVQRGPHRVRWR